MEQESNFLKNLEDFVNSNSKALTSIDLQLKNFALNNEQLTQLNISLMKYNKLESLILNLQKERIQDSQINKLIVKTPFLKVLIGTCNNMSNDQIYSHLQNLLFIFKKQSQAFSLGAKQNEMGVQWNILLEDAISNPINLKNLELNL
ncbi:hypothetical protein ABPG72_020492, partial [Tetrahymena utriculariae]